MYQITENQSDHSSDKDLMPYDDRPHIREQPSLNSLPVKTPFQKIKKTIYLGLTISSVLIDPLYCYFIYIAVRSIVEDLQEKIGLESNSWGIFFTILIGFFVFLNYICDITQVNPIEEAEIMANFKDNNFSEQLDTVENPIKKNSIRLFRYFNLSVANSIFFIDATSSAVAVAYLTNLRALEWSSGIPATIINIIYFNMLMRGTISKHSYEFMRRFLDSNNSMIINAVKSPAKSLEIIIQVLASSIFKGVASSYVVSQLLTEFFNIDEGSSTRRDFVLYTMLAASWMIIFAKTLNVHKRYFDQQFEDISPELLKKAIVSPRPMLIFDSLITSLRAASAGVLLYRHGPESFPTKFILTGSLCSFIMSHGLYVRYKSRLNQAALDIKLKDEDASEKISTGMSSEKIFSMIQQRFKTKNLHRLVIFINSGAIAVVWVSFLSFLTTLNELVKKNTSLNLDFYDLICLQQLWGVISLENDATFFQGLIFENLSYYRTKIFLERNSSHFGLAHSFFKPKADYPREYLEKFVNNTLVEPSQILLQARNNSEPFSFSINLDDEIKEAEEKPQELPLLKRIKEDEKSILEIQDSYKVDKKKFCSLM